ncbi:2-phospho-L-lactate transferase [Balneatrix alpica]|uniref:2-phospho-L-lactate transferase n=1 Tax=Balneatrix alpica TaxID=75684 RepID=UPI002738D2CA|nr:2-phospho-L-lactate transferase [Balneatrix alpica]
MNSIQPGFKVLLLAGGVGGAKLAEGLAACCLADQLSILGNVADDQRFHGLWVSPDIDTLTYSLAGLINREQGWGLKGDTNACLQALQRLGQETWMWLGDQDFATHLLRTRLREEGWRPTEIAQHLAQQLGVGPRILLPTDDCIQTQVRTAQGWLGFQEYFVRERCQPEVLELAIRGIEQARPTPEALAAIAEAELIIFAPSNPLLSIDPILAVPGIRAAISASPALKIAVSPLIAGKAVKGPAANLLQSLGLRADAMGVAEYYRDLVQVMVLDQADAALVPEVAGLGIIPWCLDTLMQDSASKERLAASLLLRADACLNPVNLAQAI